MRKRADALQHVPIHYSIRKEDHRHFGGETSVLFIRDENGCMALYEPLVDFSHAHSGQSDATRRSSVRGVGLLYDYFVQTRNGYLERFGGEWRNRWRLILQEFCNALRHGTIGPGFSDPSGLYWPPITSDAVLTSLGMGLDKFIDWIVAEERALELIGLFPFFEHINYETLGQARRPETPQRYKFLAHLRPTSRPTRERPPVGSGVFRKSSRRASDVGEMSLVPLSPALAFPSEHLISFITRGFERGSQQKDPHERVDYTGRLSALIALGGLRGSESLHMWVNDLQIVNGSVRRFLRHPEKFVESCGRSRGELLLERYNRRPKTQCFGRERVGFKNPRLNPQHWASIHWLNFEGFQHYFVDQLRFYVGVYRKAIMERRRREGLGDHPFLLVSSRHCPAKSQFVGDPLTSSGLAGRWARAVEGAGSGLKYAKQAGTTRHGMRHLVGKTLDRMGAPLQDIAETLHHRSIFSSLVYVSRSDEEVHEAFEENRIHRPEVLAALGNLDANRTLSK